MNIIDGRAIAKAEKLKIQETIKTLAFSPTLAIITCAPNLATSSYLELKKKTAETLGVTVTVIELNEGTSTAEVVQTVQEAVATNNGVVVQLPLPEEIDTKAVLDAIPLSHDVDNFRYQGETTNVYPPVVSAIDKISQQENIDWSKARVAIFGEGKLVGKPALAYALSRGATVSVVNKTMPEDEKKIITKQADIVVLGVGQANILTPDMVKEGVVVFDAGASEDGGVLVGDADKTVAEKAKLFTPVPGGIGPITVSALFHNLLELALRQ